jgi:acyl phosphate:glycerol-3-phosphate acyltransferase
VTVFFCIALGSYLIGSIPSGYIAGRIAGIDIRKVGSGNIGATNVTRSLGKGYGYPVFLADFSKGLLAVILSKFIAERAGDLPGSTTLLQIIAAGFCVIGNTFPIWLRFRGGKGVAVSAGVLFALMTWAALVVTILWLVTFQFTRYVSLASITGALALPITVLLLLYFKVMTQPLLLYVAIALTTVVVLRHRSNLSRLARGTEERFSKSGD